MRKIKYLIIALIFILCGCTSKENNLFIHFFKVGKADSILIRTNNYNVLIDTGESSTVGVILDYLKENKINKIDYLIITHFDKDHVGGAASIINELEVSNVYQSNYPKDSSAYNNYVKALFSKGITAITLRRDTSFELDDVKFKINAPKEEEYIKNPSNNSSLIVSVFNQNNSFLFMGDAENARINEYLDIDKKTYDVLKVPYHGHYQKNLRYLISSVKPKYSIITSSDNEKEDEETLNILENSEVFLTRINPVDIKSNGSQIDVKYD